MSPEKGGCRVTVLTVPGNYYEKVYSYSSNWSTGMLSFVMFLLYEPEMKKPCLGNECFFNIT